MAQFSRGSSEKRRLMITAIVFREWDDTFDRHLATFGRALSPSFRILHYEKLWRRRRLEAGTYIFSDLERLSAPETRRTSGIWRTLAQAGPSLRLLNDPARALRRYELLRKLYAEGVNEANVHRLDDPQAAPRFPCFVRGADDHAGSATEVLAGPEDLLAAREALAAQGYDRRAQIVTEFVDTRGADGLYRKYAAFVVGNRIIPRHLFIGADWVVKRPEARDEAALAEERDYVAANPHADSLLAVARPAGIDYGRIDYGVKDGRPQIFEINTNPFLTGAVWGHDPRRYDVNAGFAERLNAALLEIEAGRSQGPAVDLPRDEEARHWQWNRRASRLVRRLSRLSGLGFQEGRLRELLTPLRDRSLGKPAPTRRFDPES